MKEKIIISTLSISDWEEYKSLRLKALQDEPMAFGSSFQESVNKVKEYWMGQLKPEENKSTILFARKGNKLVGMVGANFNDKQKTKHVAVIVGAYVDSEYRGHGIGSMLMQAIIDKIKENPKIKKINLGVITTQKPAIALYEKFGFKKIGTHLKEIQINGKFYDEDLMEKFL